MTAPAQLTCDYFSLFNEIAVDQFGIRQPDPTQEAAVSSTVQKPDILRCISAGLQFVYSAYRWSFLRPIVSITTYPAYNTGTITVNSSGVVLGDGTIFPAYAATAGGWLSIPSVGDYAVATRTGDTGLTLTGFPTASAFTSASTYSLGFDSYPMSTVSGSLVDSLEGRLSYPQGSNWPKEYLDKILEFEIRRMLAQSSTPGRPRYYAETPATFDPTVGSTRFISFYPIPDAQYVLSARGNLRWPMIDATNKYPLGGEVLAPCIIESCLAAAERLIEKKDASRPDAVHNRALAPLLAMAIQMDKERGSPETLGVDHGQEGGEEFDREQGSSSIYWAGGGIPDGYI